MKIIPTDKALFMIKKIAKENNQDLIVRIYTDMIGCKGIRFGIAYDEVLENDEKHQIGDITFVADHRLNEYADEIEIDFVDTPKQGFVFKSYPEYKKSCSGCSGCGIKFLDK
ncbi:Iron-sulfur cluster insertion protein ErpA [Caloramator mitchellensis]|uniref:Iron-sulfur cluster insertion protein ErpA n=1 Tax=Caloramator mitchellensis TaxID=908809 RepID=A0A0R3K301_CALMK|nr:hypothetical protein [Caloramator mitchellensis]KRQ87950.1 Iron-sulfur cluster insertion protein ErpA [Caloramator mitchellensis]